jgi:AcrR family transcriptional regulator
MPRNRQLTEARIRAAARQLLLEEGFSAWGVNRLARAAGVDKVLIYRYFQSLEALLEGIIRSTRFWPDPDDLPDATPEAFLRATIERLQADPLPAVLLGDPRSRQPVSAIRRQFDADLERWMAGLRRRVRGNIQAVQLERLPAMIHFAISTGRPSLSSRELWLQVAPPLEWMPGGPRAADGSLPTELL